MQIFGLIGLMVTVALATWFLATSGSVSTTVKESGDTTSVYNEAVDSAKEVVEKVEEKIPSARSITVYDGISVAENTTKLDLSNRGLSGSLKAEIRHLSALKELDISYNNFTGLPAEVGQLSKLEILNLSHNPLTGLPQELGNLSNLKTLDLRGTNYSTYDLDIIKKGLPAGVTILVD